MSINLNQYQVKNKQQKKSNKKKTVTLMEFMNKDIELTNPFGAKQKQIFYTNLETLLTAGLDIQRALELVEEGYKKKSQKAIINQLKEEKQLNMKQITLQLKEDMGKNYYLKELNNEKNTKMNLKNLNVLKKFI